MHGMEAGYNDIPEWRYGDLPTAFGGREEMVRSYVVSTRAELEVLLKDEGLRAGKGVRFVDVRMPREDAPVTLRMLCSPGKR